jgi:cytochrome c
MNNKSSLIFCFALSLFLIGTASELRSAWTKQDAVNMVDSAVAYYKANGKQKTIDAINKENGPFHKGELYVYLHDLEGAVVAHPTNKSLIGQNNIKMRDPDGKFFVKEIVDGSKNNGSCWVDYKWVNPKTKKIQKKQVYCKKVDDMIFICGIYL